MTTQRQALEAALSALESERIMGADAQGDYTLELTPKRILAAVEQVKAALAEPEQEPDLRGIDAGNVSEWVHLRQHGCISADGLLITVKSIPKYLAQNPSAAPQPQEWQELNALIQRVKELEEDNQLLREQNDVQDRRLAIVESNIMTIEFKFPEPLGSYYAIRKLKEKVK